MSFDWLASRRKKQEADTKKKEEAAKVQQNMQVSRAQKRLRGKKDLDSLAMRVLHSLQKAAYPKLEVRNQDLDLAASRMFGEWSIGSVNKDGVWESRLSVFLVLNENGSPLHFKCFLLDHEENSIGLQEKDLIEALNALHDHFPDAGMTIG